MSSGSISAPIIIPLGSKPQRTLIDTNTFIDIRCNTSDVDIYYTLDGSKPDSFITLKNRPTLLYVKPFCIPRENVKGGKVTVKALAVIRGGIRESSITAKAFDIRVVPADYVDPDALDEKYIQELQQERQELMKRIQDENERLQQKLNESMRRTSIDSYVQENLQYRTQANSIQHPTELIRCSHCFTPKSTDSFTRFCKKCGLPWQKLTNNPPETPSSKICATCKSTLPFNSDACVVCEAPSSSEAPRRATLPNQARVICPQCKSGNPIHLRTCYICESVLLPTSTPTKRASVSVPTYPTSPANMVACPKCFRLNSPNAHFCDWCGTSPEKEPVPAQCTKCRAINDPFAKFCSTCGCVLEPPLTAVDTRLRYDSSSPASSMIASTITGHSAKPTWLNANSTLSYYRQPSVTAKGDAATQTYGIYYPSAKDLDLLLKQNKQILEQQELNEHRTILKPTSPGQGYWLQQLDHIHAHLKSYTTSRPDFQSLIGSPRMGNMAYATVHETEHQITVQVVFNRPETTTRSSFYADDERDYYSMNGTSSIPFSSSAFTDGEYKREKPKPSKAKSRPKSRPQSAGTTSSTESPTQQLIHLLERRNSDYRKKSLQHINVLKDVQRLLKDKSTNVNAKNREGHTILQLAIRNGHHDCLETLIISGRVKLDQKGVGGNTALHDCCLLGDDGAEPLRLLLKYGGDSLWVNDKKESVVDVASRQGSNELLAVIRKHRSDQMITSSMAHYDDHYGKSRPIDGDRSIKRS